jgi:hypothetical protein
MPIKRAMLTSAAVLAFSVFGQAASTAVFGNPAASGNYATAEPASTFTLVRGSHSGGRGGRGFAVPGPSSFAAIGPRGGRFAGRLAGRGFRHGRFVHGNFTDGRFRNRRFFGDIGFAGIGFAGTGVYWDVPYYDNNFLGGTCFANCIAAGHGPNYCSINASDFC